MIGKKKNTIKTNTRSNQPERKSAVSLMAVQEKLGLFLRSKQIKSKETEPHDYLKNKPLGYM